MVDSRRDRGIVLGRAVAIAMAIANAGATQTPAATERFTYPVEGFETSLPWVWCQQPAARGQVRPERTTVHGGMQAAALSWDFSAAPAEGCFANAILGRRLVGQVGEVRLWVYAEAEAVGTPLTLWAKDASEEVYIQRSRVTQPGWQIVAFALTGVGPGWDSGDRNRRQDRPLTLFGLAVERGGPAVGSLLLDEIEAETEATPREALELAPATGVARNLFWDEHPRLELPLRNHSATEVAGMRCRLRVADLYRERDAWTGEVAYPPIAGRAASRQEASLPLPYGAFRVHWALGDAAGDVATGALEVARFLAPCLTGQPESVQRHERRWGLAGGVFGFLPAALARSVGATWIRYENTSWADYEKDAGTFGMAALREGLAPYLAAGIEPIILQTLYQRPAFHSPDRPAFAAAYGEAMRQTALAAQGLARGFELGNEDNGPTKQLYSEVARHGAAGVRVAQPQALLANSGTAFLDLGWLEMQRSRGVLDGLDALCTHPYTVQESPEAWSIYDRLGQVAEVIDRLGGMKQQWTTEFGWHHEFSQPRRAEWTPRHLLIGAAAGLDRHGLYTWERDYGIFQSVALPPAVSVHAWARLTEGHRFAGLLEHGDELWACVFERAGQALGVAWSPRGQATWKAAVTPGAQAYDLFGNRRPEMPQDGLLALALDGGPVYVTGLAPAELDRAFARQAAHERDRYRRCLGAAALAPGSPLARFATAAQVPGAQIAAALCDWSAAQGPVGRGEQAVVAQLLRWLDVALPAPGPSSSPELRDRQASERERLRARLAEAVAGDADVPALRYLLERWERLADLEVLAMQLGNAPLAGQWLEIGRALGTVCHRIEQDGERFPFALWPYLFTVAADGSLSETLRFVPGEASPIRVRISSYSRQPRSVTVSLSLPAGWRCEPERVELMARPGQSETEIRVHCPATASSERPVIVCALAAAGLPERRVRFDDALTEPPLRVVLEPVPGLLPETPLRGRLQNGAGTACSGLLRLRRDGDTRALARTAFGPLAAGSDHAFELRLRPVAPFSYHDWPLVAEIILSDGRRVDAACQPDFACAVRTETPPTIDGDLREWATATPLHLDRPEYAQASFGNPWSPQDCSATTYLQWDAESLYVAAEVRDQAFNQTLSGTSQWIQDSLQISLARDERAPRTEIGLALTPQGPEVVSYTAPAPAVPGSRLAVRLKPGSATYEAAIPWAAVAGLETPQAGQTVRYNLVVNDDDAVTGRRFLERYGGIAHDKDVAKHGYLTLLGAAGGPVAADDPRDLLREDFEEYPTGQAPDAWQSVSDQAPVPESVVAAGCGRGGSQALRLTNAVGLKPFVYLNLARPIPGLKPGDSAELRVWIKGHGVAAPDGIVGVCSDVWGNEAFSYARHGSLGPDWQEVVLPFPVPDSGRLNLIIRNASRIDELLLDDLSVRRR